MHINICNSVKKKKNHQIVSSHVKDMPVHVNIIKTVSKKKHNIKIKYFRN